MKLAAIFLAIVAAGGLAHAGSREAADIAAAESIGDALEALSRLFAVMSFAGALLAFAAGIVAQWVTTRYRVTTIEKEARRLEAKLNEGHADLVVRLETIGHELAVVATETTVARALLDQHVAAHG